MAIKIFPKTGGFLDIVIPVVYLAFLFLVFILIWKLISPFVSLVITAIISSLLWLRRSLEKQN